MTGWKQINGKWYYFYPYMATGYCYIDGDEYRFNNSGVMITGWYKDDSGNWYYYKASGKQAKGWQKIGGKWYYFYSAMVTGRENIDGAHYRFSNSGAMITGWYKNEYNDWYYYKPNGKEAENEWVKINGKWYYFSYCMYSNGIYIINGKGYEFDKNGAMMHENTTGWIKKLDANGNVSQWRYVNKGGSLATGWKQISGKWYYFDTYDCRMYQSSWPTTIYDKKYIFNSDSGELLGINGGWINMDDGWWIYYANKGGDLVTGWKQIDGKWYYFDGRDCNMYKGGTYTINQKQYSFDENGVWIS